MYLLYWGQKFATPALCTSTGRWLSTPTCCCKLGGPAVALSQSALSWCIEPKIRLPHVVHTHGAAQPAMPVVWPFYTWPPLSFLHGVLCVSHRRHISKWSGNNDERNAAHCPELGNYTCSWVACLQKLGFMTQMLCLTQACKFLLVCR